MRLPHFARALTPRSLSGRLALLATLSTLIALAVAGAAIGQVLERFVIRAFDDRLDAQLVVLARAIGPDGRLDPARTIDLPGFDTPGSGWQWQVRSGGRIWSNGSPALALAPPPPPRRERHDDEDGRDDQHRFRDGDHRDYHPREAHDAAGRRLHLRTLDLAGPDGPITLVAGGPRWIMQAPLRAAMVPLLGSLLLLGIALAAATLVQLRLGLRPLRALQGAVARVTAGAAARVPADQPTELAPLAAELNQLIERNETQLAQARGHVANLAHGLKTPLAALALRIAEQGRDPDGSLAASIADIDRRIAHHLRRARAAAPGGRQAKAAPADAAAALITVLRGIRADRAVAVDSAIPPDLLVAVDPQDLDEMLGNLLDNAWRHARSRIALSATAEAGMARILIEDDGPGLSEAQRAEAMIAGRRLDERAPGHGFGLPITRELAELNGGALRLAASAALGGLGVELVLPVHRAG